MSMPCDDDFDATDEYLDAEQDERDKDDPRVLIPYKGLRRNAAAAAAADVTMNKQAKDPEEAKWDKKTPLCRAGDILWWLRINKVNDDAECRPVTAGDLDREEMDFAAKEEFIHPQLCVLKTTFSSDKQKGATAFAMVVPVYDGMPKKNCGEAAGAVKVHKSFLFRYERIYAKNEVIREAFHRSAKRLYGRIDFQVLKDAVDMQLGEVKDYFGRRPRWGTKAKEIDPAEYLSADLVERGRYLRSRGLEEESLYGMDTEEADTTKESVVEEEDDEPEVIGSTLEEEHRRTEEERQKRMENWAVDSDDSDEDLTRLRGVTALNAKIIRHFEQLSVQKHLVRIMKEEVRSQRHVEMTKRATYDLSATSKLTSLVNNDYLDHDEETEKKLYDLLLEKVFKKGSKSIKIAGKRRRSHTSDFKKAYIFNCLVPEGILEYLAAAPGVRDPLAEYLNNSSTVRRKRARKEREAKAQQRVPNDATSVPMAVCD